MQRFEQAAFYSPVITTFTPDGHVDFEAMAAHLQYVMQEGIDGVLIMGSIGEFYAISLDERIRLISLAKEVIGHRGKLLVGTSAMRYAEVVQLTQAACDAGVDGAVVLSPYYFPLSDTSIEAFYGDLAERFPGLRIYIYNFPDRTGYEIRAETVRNLAVRFANIVGIKDTVPGMEHTLELIRTVKPVREDFEIYSGFDNNFAANVRAGGSGCIAGLSNLAPQLCGQLAESLRQGDEVQVRRGMEQIEQLMDIYQVGIPFVPYIKKTVQLINPQIPGIPAFPLLEATEEQTRIICRILKRIGR